MDERTKRALRLEICVDNVIAGRLSEARRSKGLSLEDLAMLTGLDVEDLREAEREQMVLSPGRMIVFCRALGLDPIEIIKSLPQITA